LEEVPTPIETMMPHSIGGYGVIWGRLLIDCEVAGSTPLEKPHSTKETQKRHKLIFKKYKVASAS
jgi:hypothetical protein